ncbi:hypothetical protein D9M70_507530 [compost metagenome]
MADRDLLEAEFAGNSGNDRLMLGIFVGVHEDDGDGLVALALQVFECRARLRLI